MNSIERFIILILLELFIPFFCILWYAFRFVCFLFQMVGKFVKTFQDRPEKELADATNLPAPFWCFKVMSTYASVFPIPYERRYTGFLIKKMPEFHKFRHLGTPNWSRTSGLPLRRRTLYPSELSGPIVRHWRTLRCLEAAAQKQARRAPPSEPVYFTANPCLCQRLYGKFLCAVLYCFLRFFLL